MKNTYKNLQEAFLGLSRELISANEVNSRGSKQKEVLFSKITIDDPTDIDIKVPARKFSVTYAVAEWLWYLSANPNVVNIGKLANIWNVISDDNMSVESNYGTYILPQWSWVKNELIEDNDSRRATIVINQPYHKIKNKKDYPCTQYVQFFIRDKKLHMSVNMRSNDLIFGFCNDVFTFCLFQQLMLNDLRHSGLDVELGTYNHFAGSMHVYERHYSMLEDIVGCESYDLPTTRFVLREGFNSENCISLPGFDTEKNDIKKYANHAKGLLFNEHS